MLQPRSARPQPPHENHEVSFMMIRFRPAPALRNMGSNQQGEVIMKWETPAAFDFRWGMEITMYIAHR